MPWPTVDERLRQRAREIIYFHEKSQRCGPLPNAHHITSADLEAAKCLSHDNAHIKYEVDYPVEWEVWPRSLADDLNSFRNSAMDNKDVCIVYIREQLKKTEEELRDTQEQAMLNLHRAMKAEAKIREMRAYCMLL